MLRHRITWCESVADAINRIVRRSGQRTFSRQQLIRYELGRIVRETQSKGRTPEQTLVVSFKSYEMMVRLSSSIQESIGCLKTQFDETNSQTSNKPLRLTSIPLRSIAAGELGC